MPVELHLHPIIHKFAAVRYYIAYLTYDVVTVDEIRDLGSFLSLRKPTEIQIPSQCISLKFSNTHLASTLQTRQLQHRETSRNTFAEARTEIARAARDVGETISTISFMDCGSPMWKGGETRCL